MKYILCVYVYYINILYAYTLYMKCNLKYVLCIMCVYIYLCILSTFRTICSRLCLVER